MTKITYVLIQDITKNQILSTRSIKSSGSLKAVTNAYYKEIGIDIALHKFISEGCSGDQTLPSITLHKHIGSDTMKIFLHIRKARTIQELLEGLK